MIEFSKLKSDVNLIEKYIKNSKISFCDISLGVKYMWREDFVIDYAVVDDTLIMKETCRDYSNAFYYPMGKNEDRALNEIERYCKESNVPLKFCCIDNATAVELSNRYPISEIKNDRAWSDYIYDVQSFVTFSGKKYSGQRNHVNKFKKTYPNYKVKILDDGDLNNIKEFLHKFENENDFSLWSAREEQKKVYDLVENYKTLSQFGICVYVDGVLVSFSLGEKVGDTLIVHIEKGLKEYEGVYPLTAQEFAKAFSSGVKKINREEDCGDMGLRISKLQYHPIEVKEKNILTVKTAVDKLNDAGGVNINAEELTVTDIEKSDALTYFNLYTDKDLNKFWGYDYKEDLDGVSTDKIDKDYFYNFANGLKEKGEEYSLKISVDNKMIGELVVWNCDCFGAAEIGFRIFKEYQRKGYAYKSTFALIDYLKRLGVKKILCRCYKENAPSKNLIGKLGFIKTGEDTEKEYFVL